MKGKLLTRQDIKQLRYGSYVYFEYVGKGWNKTVCSKLHKVTVSHKSMFGTSFIDSEGNETKSTELDKLGIEVYEWIEPNATHEKVSIEISYDLFFGLGTEVNLELIKEEAEEILKSKGYNNVVVNTYKERVRK